MNGIDDKLPQGKLTDVKLVLFDMDGTTLTPEREMSPYLVERLKQLRRVIPWTFVSARNPLMMHAFCTQAGACGAVVSSDGALIVDWNSRRKLFSATIEPDVAESVMTFAHQLGVDYTFYTARHGYLRDDTKRTHLFARYNRQAEIVGVEPMSCRFYEAYSPRHVANEGVLKIFLDNPSDILRPVIEELLQRFPSLRVDCSEGRSMSITSVKASKANSVAFLSQYLGVDPANMCAFGDYHNDIGMLKAVGHSVAMGNAPDEVKQAARYVTRSHTEEGVAWFIDEFLLP